MKEVLKIISLSIFFYFLIGIYVNIPTYNKDNAGVFIAILSLLTTLIGSITTYFVVSVTNQRTIESQKTMQENQLTQQKNELLYKVSYEKSEILIELKKDLLNELKANLSEFGLYSYQSISYIYMINDYLINKGLDDNLYDMEHQAYANNTSLIKTLTTIENFIESKDINHIIEHIENFQEKSLTLLTEIIQGTIQYDNNILVNDPRMMKLCRLREKVVNESNIYISNEWEKIKTSLDNSENSIKELLDTEEK